jgi:hypothetical protein
VDHPLFLLGALGDFTGVFVHGVIGHRIMVAPLKPDRLFSTAAFGDGDVSYRLFNVVWHIITAAFFCSGAAWLLLASGRLPASLLPPFISVLHASFILVALVCTAGRLPSLIRRPIPITFFTCMTLAALVGWIG